MSKEDACCAIPRGDTVTEPLPQTSAAQSPNFGCTDGMKLLKGGKFLMGSNDATFPADGEGPVRPVEIDPFWMAPTVVTNDEFAQFIAATGYVTEAESFGWSYVFEAFLPADFEETRAVQSAPWWRQVFGADWQHPEGPHSNLDKRSDHPVVHVSHRDAEAYAAWVGLRLPTEAEWEYAARGGLKQKKYPWGEQLTPGNKHRCNIWQGNFPSKNTRQDGHLGTAPVTTYKPNKFGLYNMVGNVWEWCSDWFSPSFHANGPLVNPVGPPFGNAKVMRGGSYLCHRSYCNRYRNSARTSNTPDSSTGHMGFRLARSVE